MAPCLARALNKLCECQVPHVICAGPFSITSVKMNRSHFAHFYPNQLIKTILAATRRIRAWHREGLDVQTCPTAADREDVALEPVPDPAARQQQDGPEDQAGAVATQRRWDEAMWSVDVKAEDAETKKLRRVLY